VQLRVKCVDSVKVMTPHKAKDIQCIIVFVLIISLRSLSSDPVTITQVLLEPNNVWEGYFLLTKFDDVSVRQFIDCIYAN